LNIVGRESLEPRDRQLPQPREEIAFLVFEVTTHRGELEVRVSVDEPGQDNGFPEILDTKFRKPLDDLGARTDAGDSLSFNRHCTIFDWRS
jgi:hypothetical protein